VIYCIVFAPPPVNIPLVLLLPEPCFCALAVKLPKSVAFPAEAIVT
jgi:hypothetical protein